MAITFTKKIVASKDTNGVKHYVLLTSESWKKIERIMQTTGHTLNHIGNALVEDALKTAKTE